jgi:ATP-binding cassette subfamily F protein 3
LKDVTMNIEMGERVALLGENGAGKTTLVKLVLGLIAPDTGTVTRPPQVKVGYYSQNHVEVLRAEQGASCALAYLKGAFPGEGEQELRAHLGAFGIKGALATQPIASLSGGQAVRVALAYAVHSHPHFLVLDEPSNHLDAETVEALVESLHDFAGAVLLVTHDQYLVEKVATRTFLVQRRKVQFLEQGIEDYRNALAKKFRGFDVKC